MKISTNIIRKVLLTAACSALALTIVYCCVRLPDQPPTKIARDQPILGVSFYPVSEHWKATWDGIDGVDGAVIVLRCSHGRVYWREEEIRANDLATYVDALLDATKLQKVQLVFSEEATLGHATKVMDQLWATKAQVVFAVTEKGHVRSVREKKPPEPTLGLRPATDHL